jgi:transcriptional regulator with XRE-family HTH domain
VFGDLLRRYRLEAGLTQEALAEGSALSARAISDLERGLRTAPRKETVRLLASALSLDAATAAALERAARKPRRREPSRQFADGVPAMAAGFVPKLAGRARELALLRAKLDGAQSGSGGLVLLAGEPGIGKTRLLYELAADAGRRGMQVCWGRCWETEGAPPFWPWIEILRAVLRDPDPQRLRTQLGAGASAISELVPEVRDVLTDLPAAPSLDPAAARFRLFDAVTGALQRISLARPLLLQLDDLHWADKPSLLLLQFLIEHMADARILLAGTYRDTEMHAEHALGELMGALRRESQFELLSLTGLPLDAVSQLIGSLDQPVSIEAATLAHAVWESTEGNPLFVREELRYLLEEHQLARGDEQPEIASDILKLGLPKGVRDVIGRRLRRLSPTTRNLLTVAAVMGREFDARIVERSGTLEPAELDDALDEAEAARVVDEVPSSDGRYQFNHVLFREVLYTDIPARRRIRLHAQVAESLELEYAGSLGTHLSELAYHFGEARAVLGVDKLVHYALSAGERALASQAYEEAELQFQRGLDASVGRPIDAEQADLLFGLGRAQSATAELPRAREVVAHLTRAFDYYAREGDRDRAVAIAECPVDALPGQPVGAAQLVARALALVEPDTHAEARLLSRYARMAAIEEGNYQAAAAACERALAIARRDGDIHLEIQTLGNGAEADMNFMHWREGLDKCLRAIDLAECSDAVQAQLLARLFASILLYVSGDLRRATEQTSALLALAEQLRDRRWLVSALYIDAIVALYRGDWERARSSTEHGLALSPIDPRLLWTGVLLEREAGNLAAAQLLLTRLLEIARLSPPRAEFAQATAALVVAMGTSAGLGTDMMHQAEAAAHAILSFSSATDMVRRTAQACLAVIAVHRGDVDAARLSYAALEPARGTIIYASMVADRLLGRLAETVGDHSTAAQHFEDAVSFCRSVDCQSELAWGGYDYARLWSDHGAPQGRAHAQAMLDESLAVARQLGMRPLTSSALALQARMTH